MPMLVDFFYFLSEWRTGQEFLMSSHHEVGWDKEGVLKICLRLLFLNQKNIHRPLKNGCVHVLWCKFCIHKKIQSITSIAVLHWFFGIIGTLVIFLVILIVSCLKDEWMDEFWYHDIDFLCQIGTNLNKKNLVVPQNLLKCGP